MADIAYECMFILDPNRYARDPNGVANGLAEMITSAGGEVLASRLWNEQRLAYPINGLRKGTYWLTYFRINSLKIPALNRACQLNENVVRNLILKVDPRLIETLVAHARGDQPPATPPKDEAGDGATETNDKEKETKDAEKSDEPAGSATG